ncbi:unnamed protein product, partial [marine sediment metagenome]
GGGWVQIGGDLVLSSLTGRIFVMMRVDQLNTSGSVDWTNMAVASGTISNRIAWSLAQGVVLPHRGEDGPFPVPSALVCHADHRNSEVGATGSHTRDHGAVNIIDVDNNKLWLRFNGNQNNALWSDTTDFYDERPVRAVFDDGVVLVAKTHSGAQDVGGGLVFDFLSGTVRVACKVLSGSNTPQTGGYYGGQAERAYDALSVSNIGLGYAGDFNDWDIPDQRVYDVAIFRDGYFEYRAHATQGGIGILKNNRIKFRDSAESCSSLGTPLTLACAFDPSNGRLFYTEGTNLYSVDRATW